jgi:polyisoprenoid-binding protein YceI
MEAIVQEPTDRMTTQSLQALVQDGALIGDWILDSTKSSVRLKTKTIWGVAPVNGMFGKLSGNGTVSSDGEISGTLTVAAASIDTKNTRRDKHLRSPDFFDSANYPDITFTVDNIRPSGQAVTVTGALTVRDRTLRLSFSGTASVARDGEIWLDTEVQINRANFGLTWNRLRMNSMMNTLFVHAVFTRR